MAIDTAWGEHLSCWWISCTWWCQAPKVQFQHCILCNSCKLWGPVKHQHVLKLKPCFVGWHG